MKHWIHPKRGLLYVVFSRKRELVEKAAAGYRGLIWRRSPADLSWPGRLCPWLKGSSTLEVFGIDCSKLHHKTPLKGNVFTVSPNEGWQGRLAWWLGMLGYENPRQLQEPWTLTQLYQSEVSIRLLASATGHIGDSGRMEQWCKCCCWRLSNALIHCQAGLFHLQQLSKRSRRGYELAQFLPLVLHFYTREFRISDYTSVKDGSPRILKCSSF